MNTVQNKFLEPSGSRRYAGKRPFMDRFKIVLCIVLLILACGNQKILGQGVGISEVSITPETTSILELRSTLRGFLAPRMTSAERLAIASPAQGLLVFDMDTKSFWYFDNGWKSIAAEALGASNQLLGMNAAGTANEYKTLIEGSNILISHGIGNITIGTSLTPVFDGLTLTNPLTVPNGGTGLTTFGGTNTVLYTSAPDVLASVPASTAAGQFLQTVLAGGAPSWKTILDVPNGGTGISSITTNNLIYGNGAGPVNLLPPVGTTGALLTETATGAPGWLTLNTLPSTSGILQEVNGGTGESLYSEGDLLIGNTAGGLTRNPLTGTNNQVYVTNGNGTITLSLPQNIHQGATPEFVSVLLSGLNASSGVYTDINKVLTSLPPSSGTIGYWSRNDALGLLTPANLGDDVATTNAGTITSSGLLTGQSGATITGVTTITGATTVSGGIINLNDNSPFATNINTGTSNGNVTIGNGASSLYLPKFTMPGILHNDNSGLISSSLVSLPADITGILPVPNGGTGISSITTNNLIYGNGTGPVNLLPPVGTTGALLTETVTGAPGWLTLNTLPSTSGILQEVNGGTGESLYSEGDLLIGNTAGGLTRNPLTGTNNQVYVTNGNGTITLSLPQNIHQGATPEFVSVLLSGLNASSGVYTDINKVLTSLPPSSGTIGYWSRNDALGLLTPANLGDDVATTDAGTITSSGLLTGQSGATITGSNNDNGSNNGIGRDNKS